MLQLESIFTEGMVLQQGKPICVWGIADTDTVSINFQDKSYCVAVCEGKWKTHLDASKAGGPFTMQLTTSVDAIEIADVLVGEVFVASGQSNMTFCNLWEAHWEKEQLVCENDQLRVFPVPKISYKTEEKIHTTWHKTTAETAKDFSAIAYYCAKKLYEKLQVPIGIISCEWGGTGIQTWLDENYLLRDDDLKIHCEEYAKLMETVDMDTYDKVFAEYLQTAADVEAMLYNPATVKELGLYEFMKAPMHKLFPKTPEGPKMQNRPGGLYHTMVETVVPYTINAVVWYQGEGNTGPQNMPNYDKMIDALMDN